MSIIYATVNLQRKIKHTGFKIIKMDAVENVEEYLSTSDIVRFLIRLLVAFFSAEM